MHRDDYSGLFVVFEGGEGSGKTTQTWKLHAALKTIGIESISTCEPGDTRLGKSIRELVLGEKQDREDLELEPISKKAEALLFMADRAEHVEKFVVPALKEGKIVVCDRYIASTMAYQAYAGGLPSNTIEEMSLWASGHLLPDITFYLDIDPVLGLQRALMRGKMNTIDVRSITYHQLVRKGFQRQQDDTWVMLDATLPQHTLHLEVIRRVQNALDSKAARLEALEKEPTGSSPYCPECHATLTESSAVYICPNGHGFLKFQRGTFDAIPHA